MRKVFYNGFVYMGGNCRANSFMVENGRFSIVGTERDVLQYAVEDDEFIDLNGAFVCAGFNDSHMHLVNYGQILSGAPLYKHTGSLAEVISCLKKHLANHTPAEGAWITGRGWNHDYFTDVNRMPSRYDLDEVSHDIPIMITRACGHCCVVNSAALKLAGIDRDSVSPEGGAIGFENGEPDGRIYDNAMEILNECRRDPSREEIKQMMLAACKELNRYGITSVQTDDYCVFRKLSPHEVNAAYRELEAEGRLTVRVYEQCNFTDPDELTEFTASGEITGKGSDMLRIGPLKLLGDGALGSRTAHLSIPYKGTDNCGFSLFAPEHLKKMVSIANANGMQVAVHAIGDKCLDEVLDAIGSALEEHPRSDHRHGIVHCQISRADQIERMKKLKLHIYAQTIFLDYDNHIVEQLVDPSLIGTSYSWKTLMRGGLSVSNGSDCPVELPDVMRGIQCAVTRTSIDGTGPYLEDEAFTVSEALDSFTIHSAEASFEEDRKGRIAKGYLADFVILGANPYTVDKNKLHEIPVIASYLGGKCVYNAEEE